MKISQKASYGLRALVELARHPKGVSAQRLAEATHTPRPYLEKILQKLKKQGVVASQKGARGGYAFEKPLRDISVWSILKILDGGFTEAKSPALSGTLAPCPLLSHCETKPVWEQLEAIVRNTLSKITLADLTATHTNKK